MAWHAITKGEHFNECRDIVSRVNDIFGNSMKILLLIMLVVRLSVPALGACDTWGVNIPLEGYYCPGVG